MWFIKHVSVILLLSANLVRSVLASDAVTEPQWEVADISSTEFASSIELDAEKEYTRAELVEMFEAKKVAKRSDNHVKPTVVTEADAREFSASARSSGPISLMKAFTLHSTCNSWHDELDVQIKAIWNGAFIRFEGHKNVDKFDETSPVSRSRKDNSISSHTKFQHSACRAITPDYLCFYSYTGTALATFWPGSQRRSANLIVYPANAKQAARRLWIESGCIQIYGGDGVVRTCANWSTPSRNGLSAVVSGLSMFGCSAPRVTESRL